MKGAKIKCGIFNQEEEIIRCLSLQLGQIKRPDIRKARAEDLLDKADELLDCWMFEEENSDCNNCRETTLLRKKTVLFIIGVSELEP